VQFVTNDGSIEDTTITLFVKYTDLNNGCDTIVKRNVLVYPTISPDFTYPTRICDGDAVAFENTSTVKSGSMEFSWDFGTGNAADKTDAPEPVFQFPGPGKYKVKMTAKTLPWGFPAWDSVDIVVSPIPTVAFTKSNACEGLDLVFTNQTTPSSSTYVWDFGDAGNPNNTSTLTDPTKTYKNTGSYTVTLKADLQGCVAQTSQRVYQFDKPKADFVLASGSCDNEMFAFTNKTTIKNGLFGTYWDFNTGDVSTEVNSNYMFPTPGSHDVKLTSTSEFGCEDEITKTVVVKESPKVSFTNTNACSLTPTTFTNLTPDVSGSIANYDWDFGDGATSTAKSPVHSWTGLGPKTIMLVVNQDNGCSSSASKLLSVGVQPKASFTATNVCSGDPVVFENNTTWAQGDITYLWDFGDATSSTNSDPVKNYGAVNKTTTYNVTLTAQIAGGCSDISGKQITVNESPKTCDFKATADYAFGYYGVSTEPVDGSGITGAQSGVTYTWIFQGGGTQTGPKGQYDLVADGNYSVTMRAKVISTGCECTVTKNVVMDRSAVTDLESVGAAVYPNPSNGNFNIALTENFGQAVSIEITSISGTLVKALETENSGLIAVNAGDIADGMYLVRVRSGNRSVTRKITVRR
jgi:PKD repeat protein